MKKLDAFSEWMHINSKLADSSIYKYTRAINTISKEMIEKGIIYKSLLEMNCVELDVAILNILKNDYFLQKNTTGNHMYSNALKQYRYFNFEDIKEDESEKQLEDEVCKSKQLTTTEKQMIIKARIGQGKYRTNLLEKYEGKCIVTGIDKPKLLVASHIKPWAICNNVERIDKENGLLLCPNMDRLFDCGLITFTNEGRMILSSFIGKENIQKLHISDGINVDLRATKELLCYLEYHRDVLFVK